MIRFAACRHAAAIRCCCCSFARCHFTLGFSFALRLASAALRYYEMATLLPMILIAHTSLHAMSNNRRGVTWLPPLRCHNITTPPQHNTFDATRRLMLTTPLTLRRCRFALTRRYISLRLLMLLFRRRLLFAACFIFFSLPPPAFGATYVAATYVYITPQIYAITIRHTLRHIIIRMMIRLRHIYAPYYHGLHAGC